MRVRAVYMCLQHITNRASIKRVRVNSCQYPVYSGDFVHMLPERITSSVSSAGEVHRESHTVGSSFSCHFLTPPLSLIPL